MRKKPYEKYKKWLLKNTEDLSGKTVAITGSTGGLGKELSRYFAYLGASLILVDRSYERSLQHKNSLCNEFPKADIKLITADLSNFESVKRAGELLESIFESIPTIGERETVYNYAKIEGTQILKYTPSYNDSREFEGYKIYTSEKELDEELSEIVAIYIPVSLRDYEDYTYNEANETYECADGEVEGGSVTNIRLKFEDGKLISFRFTMEIGSETATVSGTVTYGNAEVTLPSDEEIIEIVD